MAVIKCEITGITAIVGSIDGVMAACSQCGHETESYGTSHASVLRCLVLLREECPLKQRNYYIPDDHYVSIEDYGD